MAKKVNVSEFLRYYGPHAVVTNGKASSDPPASQYGYVMGGNGSVATDAYIKRRAKKQLRRKLGALLQRLSQVDRASRIRLQQPRRGVLQGTDWHKHRHEGPE